MPKVIKPEEIDSDRDDAEDKRSHEEQETIDVPPGWTAGRYEMVCDGFTLKVDAILLHGVAVYRTIQGDQPKYGKWSVGSVRVGYRICAVDLFIDAVRIGQYIDKRCRMVFEQKTKERIYANAPTWLREWALACTAARCYVNPEPHIKAPTPPSGIPLMPPKVRGNSDDNKNTRRR